jgi:DNA repair protein RecO
MYAIHTTPGFIIDSRPYGEAGKMISIFTRDLGLILATAQGIRFEKSKLRYHAREYSFGTFSFVRGKELWRMTSVTSNEIDQSGTKESQQLIARIALVLKRLLHGEEPNMELFDAVEMCHLFLYSVKSFSEDQLKTLESLVMLRILHYLGYVGKDIQMSEFFASKEISPEVLEKAAPLRQLMNQHINIALKESHL